MVGKQSFLCVFTVFLLFICFTSIPISAEPSVAKIENLQPNENRNLDVKGKFDYSLKEKMEERKEKAISQSVNFTSSVEAFVYIKPGYIDSKKQDFTWVIQNISEGLESNGIKVVDSRANPITVELSNTSDLKKLNSTDFVSYIRDKEKLKPRPAEISEGVSLIGAQKSWDRGYSGQGVNVGVFDNGFEGWEDLKDEGELPQNTLLYDRVGIGDHGSACAEVLYDVAPNVSGFYLAAYNLPDNHDAIDWFKDNEVDVISQSLIYVSWNPRYLDSGDGEEFWDDYKIIEYAVDNGITWVNSAGNYRDGHWEGDWHDNDSDGVLDVYKDGTDAGFIESDREAIQLKLKDGKRFDVWVRWDDYGYPSNPPTNDFDIELRCFDGSDWVIEAHSNSSQNGYFGEEPFEYIGFTPSFSGKRNCSLYVEEWDAPNASSMHFDIWWEGDSGTWNRSDTSYDPIIESGSIASPADHPDLISVGAVLWDNTSELEYFSSMGPAYNPYLGVNNLKKPDLVAPDGVSTESYGNEAFRGTSAAAPHVTGVAALLLSSNPSLTPDEVKQKLEESADDLGVIGKDNYFGSGLVNASNATLDTTPPASITGLRNTTYAQTYINWTWTDPPDDDFDRVEVYLDGAHQGDVAKGEEHFNATDLSPSTVYELGTRTVDDSGNIGEWFNDTATTAPAPDITPPASITSLQNTT
ncbi:MAG: S8 family serine peptidase, partial [Halobacteriota archaeon]